jgi:mono/diheme cytochrome c family protein
MKEIITFTLFTSGLFILGCDNHSEQSVPSSEKPVYDKEYDRSQVDPVRIKQGRELYLKNCTVCHGLNAEGSPDWRQRDKDGKFPAPPLNGTGHAWHHPKQALMYTIKNGTRALGGNMPAWKDRLTDAEIESIILWFQSKWPDELYQAWVRMDKESK